MNVAIKVIATAFTIGWVYGIGKKAGKDEVLDKMRMFAAGMNVAEEKKDAKEG